MEAGKKQAKTSLLQDLGRVPAALSRHGGPMYQQVYDQLAQMIDGGSLVEGARLPPSRFLAKQLAVSRATVAYAYDLLASDGYINGRGSAGTFVRRGEVAQAVPEPAGGSARAGEHSTRSWPGGASPLRLAVGMPPIDLFPRQVWAQLMKRRANRLRLSDLEAGDPQGLFALRRAMANRLAITRGIRCAPDQVFVVAGIIGATRLIGRALLKRGDLVMAEDPRDPRLVGALPDGVRVAGVPVDACGMQFETREAIARGARMVIATPGCQFPLGVPLSADRRARLLEWSSTTKGWIVEHDLQSEFRFEGPALPSLASHDASAHCIFVSHLSELLFPGLGISCVVVPTHALPSFRQAADMLQTPPGTGDQEALVEMIRRGHVVRFTDHAHRACASRRRLLSHLLDEGGVRTYAPPLGLHVLAELARVPSAAVLARWRGQGLAPVLLRALSPSGFGERTLVLGFGSTPEHLMADAVAVLLRECGA